MKLSYLKLCGFRGYTEAVEITFGESFTVIDGRNGVGKSTISDAIEFALTGTISKYQNAKSDSESVQDYIWWRGQDLPRPKDSYVEVGFASEDGPVTLVRRRYEEEPTGVLDALTDRLCYAHLAPSAPLKQLCATAIIRDELIADLSLDLKDTERYSLIKDAIGATDANFWIERATSVHKACKARLDAAENEVERAAAAIETAQIRSDQLRAAMPDDVRVSEASSRLSEFVGRVVTTGQLLTEARSLVGDEEERTNRLISLIDSWDSVLRLRTDIGALELSSTTAAGRVQELTRKVSELRGQVSQGETASTLRSRARDLANLSALGHRLGLHDDQCPLCAAARTPEEFRLGVQFADKLAHELDEAAAERGRIEDELSGLEASLASAIASSERASSDYLAAKQRLETFDSRLTELGLPPDVTLEGARSELERSQGRILRVQADLRLVQSTEVAPAVERSLASVTAAISRHRLAEGALGRARRGEQRAQTMLDAARRAAAETLDQRLARVLPLMSELYQRLRPHPIWDDIEYRIRGDVRRFLRLQVGGELNPQFMFSSGQRRATGLAFLLSVNLALVWSKWRSIILDDPVQHIDDFRSVHLAEVLAQLVAAGRQIIVSVEDPSLADFLSRRLPAQSFGSGKRMTLGPRTDGALAVLKERVVAPMPVGTLVAAAE